MGTGIRYTNEFKQEAVNQVSVHGYDVAEVAKRLGVSTKSLYKWQKEFAKPAKKREEQHDLQAEVARLKRELKRTQKERDILKEAAVKIILFAYCVQPLIFILVATIPG